ncbi:MAG: SH3 domain-containing protein [Thermomicrobiales bacterium]
MLKQVGWTARLAVVAMTVSVSVSGGGMRPAQVFAQEAPMAVAAAETIQLREQPGYDAAPLLDLAPGDALEIAGDAVAGTDGAEWLPVMAAGVYGFLPSWAVGAAWAAEPVATDELVSEQPAPDATGDEAAPVEDAASTEEAAPVETAPVASAAYTMFANTDLNVRAAPQADAEVLTVVPAASPVEVSGDRVEGYLPVNAGGIDGWAASEYLAESAPAETAEPAPAAAPADPAPADAAAPSAAPVDSAPADPAPDKSSKTSADSAKRERPASVIALPFRGGTWQVIQGYNGGTHTNRSDFAKYKYALDWARMDGDTAGAPIYATVAGTIGWTDAGSGGLMIDTGAGWGLVMFHVMLDRGMDSGATVEQGQQLGHICYPSDPGFMSEAHMETDVWLLNADGSHDPTPFTGQFTIAGYDLPDVGGNNQHMGFKVSA